MIIDLTVPPPGAIDLYAQGVSALERLGWPVSCLRVYYSKSLYLKMGEYFPRSMWIWNGRHWNASERHYTKGHNTRLREYRKGAWAEFASIDEAKIAGAKRCETKVFPSEQYGNRHNYKLPAVHPARGLPVFEDCRLGCGRLVPAGQGFCDCQGEDGYDF